MAGSVNKVILVGNLGKDVEVRTMQQSGGRVASLRVATSESWKDKTSGERKEKTEWHQVSIYNDALIGVAERYLKKGSKVYLEGQLETRKYTDKDGNERYTTEVVLRQYRGEMTLLDSREGGQGSSRSGDDDGINQDRDYGSAKPSFDASTGGRSASNDLDDEIPF